MVPGVHHRTDMRRFRTGIIGLALLLPACSQTPRTLRVGYSDFYPSASSEEAGPPIGLGVQVVQEAASRSLVAPQWFRVGEAEAPLRSGAVDIFPLLTVTAE